MSKEPTQQSNELLGWTKQELEEALAKVKQPYYDFEVAEICKWLKAHGKRMRVKLDGSVRIENKDDPW